MDGRGKKEGELREEVSAQERQEGKGGSRLMGRDRVPKSVDIYFFRVM